MNYNAALNHSRTVQNRAFAQYQSMPAERFESMHVADRDFWKLAKEIGGLDQERSTAAPSVDDLASHFADKMSNGKHMPCDGFTPKLDSAAPLSGWKVRRKKVLKALRGADPAKSANGISPAFWKRTADVVHDAVTSLFKFIVKKYTWPTS